MTTIRRSDVFRNPSAAHDTLLIGAIAGVTAGVAMGLWAILTSVFHGLPITASFETIGATLMGRDAIDGGLGTTLYGFIVHGATSAGLGMLFTSMLPPDTPCPRACAAGIGFGLFILFAMSFVILPIVNPVMREAVSLTPKSWVIQHAIFGVTLGVVPLLWRNCVDDAIAIRHVLPMKRPSLPVRRRDVVAPHAIAKLPPPANRALQDVRVLRLEPNPVGDALPLEGMVDRRVSAEVRGFESSRARERAAHRHSQRPTHPGRIASRPATGEAVGGVS